jgi:hypothetical protein
MARKAVLCGVNAYANAPLRGCINDAHNIRDLLVSSFGFDPGDIHLLEDGQVVKTEVLKEWSWLTTGAQAGDTLVFHFSGHGSYVPDENGDEQDLRDEITCLHDMNFEDPNTYLSDDEWYVLTQQVDPSVRLIVIKDTCHSGGSSRFIGVRADDGMERIVLASPADLQGHGAGDLIPERAVSNARFLVPPHVPAEAWRGGSRSALRSRQASVPQTSLQACRETQTAADASIAGDFHGAFTYHFCQVLRGDGSLTSTEAIDAVAQQLRGTYEQVPQHEGREVAAPIFGTGEDGQGLAEAPLVTLGEGDGEGEMERPESQGVVTATQPEPVTTQQMVYRAHMKFLDTMAALEGVSLPERGLRAGERVLVTVHGIGSHAAGYSDDWWRALAPHVGTTFDPSELGRGRQEVVWSDLVNQTRSLARSLPAAEVNALRQSILDVIDDRRDQVAARSGSLDQLPSTRGGALSIDDFLVYMLDEGMRRRIIERFTRVVGPLLANGTRVDVISHSWGTVVAYEGLRELEQRSGLSGRVSNWFTVGSALSIAPVQAHLRPQNRPADGRRAPKPLLVDSWINLDAQGDLVGGPLGRRFPVNREYLELQPTGCRRQWWGYDVGCAHGSYFKVPNLPVNRDIFAAHILGLRRTLTPGGGSASSPAAPRSITISSNGAIRDHRLVGTPS